MGTITRLEPGERYCKVVIHGDTVYLSGVTARGADDIQTQTRATLEKIDQLLAQAGSDKNHLLSAQIWLKDIGRDFDGMNQVWQQWAPKDALPTRATCEAALAAPDLLVEIIITAARVKS